jgi:hypothetical protein
MKIGKTLKISAVIGLPAIAGSSVAVGLLVLFLKRKLF